MRKLLTIALFNALMSTVHAQPAKDYCITNNNDTIWGTCRLDSSYHKIYITNKDLSLTLVELTIEQIKGFKSKRRQFVRWPHNLDQTGIKDFHKHQQNLYHRFLRDSIFIEQIVCGDKFDLYGQLPSYYLPTKYFIVDKTHSDTTILLYCICKDDDHAVTFEHNNFRNPLLVYAMRNNSPDYIIAAIQEAKPEEIIHVVRLMNQENFNYFIVKNNPSPLDLFAWVSQGINTYKRSFGSDYLIKKTGHVSSLGVALETAPKFSPGTILRLDGVIHNFHYNSLSFRSAEIQLWIMFEKDLTKSKTISIGFGTSMRGGLYSRWKKGKIDEALRIEAHQQQTLGGRIALNINRCQIDLRNNFVINGEGKSISYAICFGYKLYKNRYLYLDTDK